MRSTEFRSALQDLPLVAILRWISPDEVEAAGEVLVEENFRLIEVPLNSPDPFTSIERLVRRFGDRAMIGAGTVRTDAQLDQLRAAGGSLMVTPVSSRFCGVDDVSVPPTASLYQDGFVTIRNETTPTQKLKPAA